MMTNAKFFADDKKVYLREKLLTMDESKFGLVSSISLKDPTIILIVSLLAGTWGIDRFMLGQTGLGIAKLLTLGGLGIWTIIDWFLVMKKAREVNFNKVMLHI